MTPHSPHSDSHPAPPAPSTPPAPPKAPLNASRILAIVIALVVVFLFLGSLSDTGMLRAGTPAPPFVLERANPPYNAVSLSDLEGSAFIIDFWSTSCPPCLREMDVLKRLYARYQDQGLRIVGISIGGETTEDVQRFSQARGITYPMLRDPHNQAAMDYRVSSLPALYILDGDKNIAASLSGFRSESELDAHIRKVLSLP